MPTQWYTPKLWPKRRLNIVAGASGAGKTRWSTPQLFALQEGKPIMGQPTKPTKIAYIACDRTSEDAKDTMSDMGFDPSKLFIFSFMDNEIEWCFTKIVEVIPVGTQLTFIEALGALIPGGKINDYHEVLRFGRRAHSFMRQSGTDFMGTTHTTKLKKDEEFRHTRENIIGSAAWAAIAGTIVLIDELPTEQRNVHILTRDDAAQHYTYEFSPQGHLVECNQAVGSMLLDRWLAQLKPGTEVQTSFIHDAGEKFKLSRATITRWISDCVADGKLELLNRGLYKIKAKQ